MSYNPHTLRVLACLVLICSSVVAQNPQSSKLFPIPEDMHEVWRDAGLSDTDAKLLKKVTEADLAELERDCEKKSTFDSVAMAGVTLGKLGKGILVNVDGSCSCGATGNCPIYAYVREKDRYRVVLGSEKRKQPYGWAFAVVNLQADIPDLVFAANGGGGLQGLSLYRYLGDRFVMQACETIRKKSEKVTSWWDPSGVEVLLPCVRP